MAAAGQVVGGVDPHADTIHVAVVTALGKVVGDAEFTTTAAGYVRAIEFLTAQGVVERVGVEGAACYGAGITRALGRAGIAVVEVERPTRSARRRAGKSDRLDAYHAARAVQAERSNPVKHPALEGLRALNLARRSAVKARTAANNQMKAILVMAPDPVRARFAGAVRRPARRGGIGLPRLLRRPNRGRHDGRVEDPGRPASRPRAADRHLDRPDRPAGHRSQPWAAGRVRGRARRRGQLLDHRRHQPRPVNQRTLLRRLMRGRARPGLLRQDPARGCPAAGTGTPTRPCTASPWSGCPTTRPPAATCTATSSEAEPKRRFCGC